MVACLAAVLALASCGERGAAADAPDEPREPAATVFLAGMGEMWVVDAGSGEVERVAMPQLGAGDPPHLIVAIGDRLAMWDYHVTSVPMSDPSAEPTTIAKHAWIFIPAADPERIWVGFLDPASPATERGLGELREIDSAGNVITAGIEPPDGAWPYAEVGGGLLFQSPRPTLWDPHTGRTLRTWEWDEIGDMGPVVGDLLASSTYRTGELILTDVTTGEQRHIAPPDDFGLLAWEGAFSPDGSTLAVPVAKIGDQNGDQELALVDVGTGDIELVPGARVRGGYVFTAWSRDGSEVFMTGGGPETPRQVVSYTIGDEHSRVLDIGVGDFYDIAVG